MVGATETFNPYANPNDFLLGAYLFEDVGVTAYKGAAPLLTSKVFLEAAAGILAAEAYHAGLVRTVLYARGVGTAALLTASSRISDARDALDQGGDTDQGLTTAAGAATARRGIGRAARGAAALAGRRRRRGSQPERDVLAADGGGDLAGRPGAWRRPRRAVA